MTVAMALAPSPRLGALPPTASVSSSTVEYFSKSRFSSTLMVDGSLGSECRKVAFVSFLGRSFAERGRPASIVPISSSSLPRTRYSLRKTSKYIEEHDSTAHYDKQRNPVDTLVRSVRWLLQVFDALTSSDIQFSSKRDVTRSKNRTAAVNSSFDPWESSSSAVDASNGIKPLASPSTQKDLRNERAEAFYFPRRAKSIIEKLMPSSTDFEKDVISGKQLSNLWAWILALSIGMSVVSTGYDSHAFVATPRRQLQSDELATVKLFTENTPSVVYITNIGARRDVFTLDVLQVPQGSGSGFVWDKEGHVVTNYHVIRGASDLRVTFIDQSEYEADVVGFDEDKDVAVLKINAPKDKLKPIPIGSSADLLVGQKVYAIGNPFGLDHTLTTGVISGLRREISSAATGRPIQDVIQTDAAINPGNSGGPLLDSSGNLIGINTAIYSTSGASSGVGFSIPVDTVSGIVEQIIKYGKVTRPILGISFAPEQSVEQLGVNGVLVLDVPPTGPAGKAGLRPTKRDSYGRLVLGDIITAINGQKVTNGTDLYKILDRCKIGDEVIVEVLRGDDKVKLPVVLESRA
ncbi:hypothetical protein O6H91_21G051500 [Diphasiastrum complanatum]|uniref:Uncharacterized protein n=3 Tax=Diphasiastrum complanatum TaxID=34168 RepID=A0ACC2AKE5_DIPCM|nr:hypothetical protein O6H91_24G002200 [Diphasiastrum complanatum]KAJ7518024.1 hypothetical protein O6H91_21G051500 [Diphasiastrum complanatum]KAJ7518025.1 hypothetical protein O6H91_21G051500 [Diphasiastrum complanatum]